jgi:hypothetical protein
MWSVIARSATLVALVTAACGDQPARVRLAPVALPGGCGKPASSSALRVIAYTAGGELRRTVPPADIDAFPADTEQLGVEVIGNGGVRVAIGKTAPLVFDELPDGTEIPIVMAPPDGYCPVGDLGEPRVAPLVARAGPGVLVVGGLGPGGERLATAEYYDPTTATFSPVAVPAALMDPDNGLAGAVLTELPDGRVALSGTASHALALFSADDRRFTAPNLFDHRAFHGAVAVDADHLLVIGGCADVSAGACTGPNLRTGFVYDLRDVSARERGPALPDMAIRIGARTFDLGVQDDGVRRFLLAGGVGDAGAADRFAVTDFDTEPLGGLHAQHALLDGGAVLTAFAADGAAPTGASGILGPSATAVVPVGVAPALDGARLVTLEDGSVLAIGGDGAGRIARFVPTTGTWQTVGPAGDGPGPIEAPAVVRLDDGSLLVVGGRAGGTRAWLYRPSLTGPSTGSIVAVPDGSTDGVITVPEPAFVSRAGGQLVLVTSADDLRARALVGGPRFANGSVSAIVRVRAGGVALIGQQVGPGRALIGRLVPGEPARIQRLDRGEVETLCSGGVVTAAELSQPVTLTARDGEATLSIGTADAPVVKASCAAGATTRGAWGLAAAGTGGELEVGPITVERRR